VHIVKSKCVTKIKIYLEKPGLVSQVKRVEKIVGVDEWIGVKAQQLLNTFHVAFVTRPSESLAKTRNS
jgi:hypothetical protein